MRRIMIIGCGGSGKSTLSKTIHQKTGIPLIHLDSLFWNPNWVETEKVKWEKIVSEISKGKEWITDGNYGSTMDIRFKEADTIIFMDRSRWLCIFRVLKRTISNYGKTREDMGPGCREKFSWDFLKYIYNYNRTRRPKILEKLKKLAHSREIVILRTNNEVNHYINGLRK